MHSRKREQQLTEAHERLIEHRESLQVLCELIRRNTQAIERFEQTQQITSRLLQKVCDDLSKRAA